MMKFFTCLLFLAPLLMAAEWIEPPVRSGKGYRVPSPDYSPLFPGDHGAHREYGLEWWYWVGHLKADGNLKNFGFQSTVFRVAGDPVKSLGNEDGLFGNRHLFLAHSALSDIKEKRYIHHERVMREGWQARADSSTLSLLAGGIEAEMLPGNKGHRLITRYPNGGRLELELFPLKPLVRFGERGLSRKGDGAASVSWYWSYTRLQAEGTLYLNNTEHKVRGEAWMDHEISSSQLGQGLAGWDWTCMQLNDGTEVKAYRLRQEDGGSDRWSSVYWIDSKGEVAQVYADHFTWEEEDAWTSPATDLSYPTSVKIAAIHPIAGQVSYYLRPLLANQEFLGNRADNAYWEGACEVLDEDGVVIGRAYLELAGYGGGLGARLN